MTIEPNHACDRCGETFALSAPQSGPWIEIEHFLETGCRGGVLQTGSTPLDDLERQMEEFAKRMGSAGAAFSRGGNGGGGGSGDVIVVSGAGSGALAPRKRSSVTERVAVGAVVIMLSGMGIAAVQAVAYVVGLLLGAR